MDKRSKADDVYQGRLHHDVKAIGKSNYKTGSRCVPLADIHDDKTMNWQNNTMRQMDDAKEMNFNHITDDTTSHTTNDTRLVLRDLLHKTVVTILLSPSTKASPT